MATTGRQLSSEMALGAQALRAQGEAVRCWIHVTGGMTRHCFLLTCEDESGAAVWLRWDGVGVEKVALVATSRVKVADVTAQRLLLAYAQASAREGETEGARVGREASQSEDVINARLWAAHQASARRRNPVTGQFSGHSCEPAGRR